jgi:hypothetical protein
METMRPIVSRFHRGLAWVAIAGFAVQFYLVGAALFGLTTFQLHRIVGDLLVLVVALLLILALTGLLGRRTIGLSVLLLVLVAVQALLPSLRASVPWLAALHPVNALALIGVAAAIGRGPRTEPRGLTRSATRGRASIDNALASEGWPGADAVHPGVDPQRLPG